MNKYKFWFYTILQGILIICLIAFWIPFFTQKSMQSTADFSAVQSAITSAIDSQYYPVQSEQRARRFLNLDPSVYDQIYFARLDDTMSARELVLVEFDPANKDSVEQALTARKNAQADIYEGYAPEQADMSKAGAVDVWDNYALLYIGDSPDSIQDLFEQALGG